MMKRLITWLCLASISLVSCTAMDALETRPSSAEARYNVILIMADDIGVSDFGVYGGQSYSTPVIDGMAREGHMFENAHSQPLCTPSRVKIMTGQHNYRNYTAFAHMAPELTTFGHYIQANDYATLIAGKWQLYRHKFADADLIGMLPETAGFDEHFMWQVYPEQRGSRYWNPTLNDNDVPKEFPEDAFGPELINDRVLDFIERKQNEPFFIYYPMVLPHGPFVKTPDDQEADTIQEKYAAMVTYMDKLVGKVRQKVEALDLADHTVIIFLADNGTNTKIESLYRGQVVQGAKGKTIQGATHVPLIVWGGPVSSGRTSALVDINDIFPTLMALTGTSHSSHLKDGRNLVPDILGREGDDKPIFIHYEPRFEGYNRARYAFDHRWKLYEDGRLYDMLNDPLEHTPLGESLTDEARQAKAVLQTEIDSHEIGRNFEW